MLQILPHPFRQVQEWAVTESNKQKAGELKLQAPAHTRGHSAGKQLSENDLKRICKECGERFFSAVSGERTRATGTNWNKWCFLNIRDHFFTARVTDHCHRLPREVVESPSLKIYRSLVMALGKKLPLLEQTGGTDDLQGSLPISTILWYHIYWFPHCSPFSFSEPLGLFLIVAIPSISSAAQIFQDNFFPSICTMKSWVSDYSTTDE